MQVNIRKTNYYVISRARCFNYRTVRELSEHRTLDRSKKQCREDAMSVVNPLTKDKAPTEAHGLFDALSKQFGKMPNIFGLMARRPDVLRKFLPFYSAVMEGGTVEHRYKELAYLKTSLINACEY